ncbi:hypothetical protein Snoj_26490 [Streptomyces nojiriensis]|uniref:Secreted protein n=1 Tax=Streptomyces nojiriensis TaxID=66374 RepID=A0ABQ3SKS7_9ACTN|nr:hypothetical protein [Streptomyces nojiriensis]QTI50311.1 hypothetical protein JYK04_08188 [Streptomyces nojiriensis]GGS29896.1 hypothetical protein GCM10010205_70090 [Streptomyces nojiriensis]GHI68731.1 hypothetical protein Snoj_26490 [Streptomyces nojiriensis]
MRFRILAVAAATAAMLLVAGAPAAVASQTAPAGSDDCSWPFCGVVYNRSGHTILIMRDASGPNDSDCTGDLIAYLPDGRASDKVTGWKDTDCWTESFGTPWHRFSSHPIWVY